MCNKLFPEGLLTPLEQIKGYIYIFAAQDSLIKPLFYSFELASESSVI